MGAAQVPVRALDAGDVTRFWYEEFDPLTRRGPIAVAGMTQFGPMFVVERLAAERGMCLALRVEHCAEPGGTLVHRVTAPHETLALASASPLLASDWPALIAELALQAIGDGSPRRTAELTTRGTVQALAPVASDSFIHYYTPYAMQQGHSAALDGPLYSWLVAPRAQRG
jgi:hypothetical protein